MKKKRSIIKRFAKSYDSAKPVKKVSAPTSKVKKSTFTPSYGNKIKNFGGKGWGP